MALRYGSGSAWLCSAGVFSSLLWVGPAFAQITPDSSLGVESSIVTPGTVQGLPADLIEGGAARGVNLFHSFSDFNVNAGQSVYFANPMGIGNILSRVTGGNVSNIDGLLGVDGAANLFLLNPNGVVFGPDASLDISGSFVTSTGSSFTFADGSEFSATPTGNELLTVSVPTGVQFNDQPQGDITNQGNLTVAVGETLTLFGDTVVSSGALQAEGGTVQLLGTFVGLVDQATVEVSGANGGGTVLVGGEYLGQGLVPTAQRTFVGADVVITADALGNGDGGRVIVWADDATSFAGSISAQGGLQSGDGGFVEVSGAESLNFAGTVNTQAVNGETGQLLLDPTNILIHPSGLLIGFSGYTFLTVSDPISSDPILRDFFYAASENSGDRSGITPDILQNLLDSNDLTLEATNLIEVGRTIFPVTITLDTPNNLTLQASNIEVEAFLELTGGGDLILETPQTAGNSVVVNRRGALRNNVASDSTVAGGQIRIITHDLTVQSGGEIATNTLGSANSGPITISATGEVKVDGDGSTITSQVGSAPPDLVNPGDNDATGNSGGINITAGTLTVQNNGSISSDTFNAQGNDPEQSNSGPIVITATGDVTINSPTTPGNSTIRSEVGSQNANDVTGDSGGVYITARNLVIQDSNKQAGSISTSNFAKGRSGPIRIETTNGVEVDGFIRSTLFAFASDSAQVQDITIITPSLSVLGSITTSNVSSAQSPAGDIVIQANGAVSEDLNIDISGNNNGIFSSTSSSPGAGGNITLSAPGTLNLSGAEGTLVAVTSFGNAGPAGNINVFADAIVLDGGAQRGGVRLQAGTQSATTGGNVNISGRALAMRRGSVIIALSDSSDATSSGGNVTINTSFLVSPSNENNDIIAIAAAGSGGRIEVNALSILGFNRSDSSDFGVLRNSAFNEVSASAQSGNDGTVEFNSLELDPSQGITELPADLSDRSNQITPGCGIANTDDGSSFVITGGGGLPPNPSDQIAANDIEVDWITYDGSGSTGPVQIPSADADTDFTQAQAMVIDPDGTVHFVVDAAATEQASLTTPHLCAATAQH